MATRVKLVKEPVQQINPTFSISFLEFQELIGKAENGNFNMMDFIKEKNIPVITGERLIGYLCKLSDDPSFGDFHYAVVTGYSHNTYDDSEGSWAYAKPVLMEEIKKLILDNKE